MSFRISGCNIFVRPSVFLIIIALVCGCSSHFTVATLGKPIIYPPGAQPDVLPSIPLDMISVCDGGRTVTSSDGRIRIDFRRGIDIEVTAGTLATDVLNLGSPAYAFVHSPRVLDGGAPEGIADAILKLLLAADGPDPCIMARPRGGGIQRPTALALAADAIVAGLPRTFADDKRVRSGWDPATRTVDLLPGMRLRIEHSIPISPDQVLGTSLGSTTYLSFQELPDDPSPVIAIEGSLRDFWMELDSSGTVNQACYSSGEYSNTVSKLKEVSGSMDLLPGMPIGGAYSNWKFWRLFYPKTWSQSSYDPNCPAPLSSTQLLEGLGYPIVVAAASRAAFEDIDLVTGNLTGCNAPNRCFALLARAFPVAEILVELNGRAAWKPVGTTVGQVIAASASDLRPLIGTEVGFSPPTQQDGQPDLDQFLTTRRKKVAEWLLARVELKRRLHGDLFEVQVVGADRFKLFDLPLASGDVLSW